MRLELLTVALLRASTSGAAAVSTLVDLPYFVPKAIPAALKALEGFVGQTCTSENVVIRKEWRTLSAAQRKEYVQAVQCMMDKSAKTPSSLVPGAKSRFDDFAATHINQTMNIHYTADFLSWHRWFIWEYEQALRNECGYSGFQPYWDWSLDAANVTLSPVFDGSETSMGSNGAFIANQSDPTVTPKNGDPPFSWPPGTGGGCVTHGPFVNMSVNLGPLESVEYNPRCLKRSLNQWTISNWCNSTNIADLFQYADIETFQLKLQGDTSVQSLGVHGGGHRTLGADPGQDLFASPLDPAFYLHHAMIDRVWWLWQLQEPVERVLAFIGTHTFQNEPESEEMSLDEYVDLGYAADWQSRQLKSLMSSLDGPFCYIYL